MIFRTEQFTTFFFFVSRCEILVHLPTDVRARTRDAEQINIPQSTYNLFAAILRMLRGRYSARSIPQESPSLEDHIVCLVPLS